CTPAALSSCRISAAVNSFAPCRALCRRATFLVGWANLGPKRAPLLGHPFPQGSKVFRVAVGRTPALAKRGNQFRGRLPVLKPGAVAQLAGRDQLFLVVQVCVRQVLDGQRVLIRPGFLARRQGVLLFQVLLQGAVGVVPRPKVVQLAADLL